ncbi:phenol degradation protein, partial [Pseudomonas aeruginosa]|nr:phenol degradation protein [Pseudomonas aeruginosa]
MRAALLPTFGALSAALCLEARADAVHEAGVAERQRRQRDGVGAGL